MHTYICIIPLFIDSNLIVINCINEFTFKFIRFKFFFSILLRQYIMLNRNIFLNNLFHFCFYFWQIL